MITPNKYAGTQQYAGNRFFVVKKCDPISKIVPPKITKITDQNQKLALFATHVLNYVRYTKSFSPIGGRKGMIREMEFRRVTND